MKNGIIVKAAAALFALAMLASCTQTAKKPPKGSSDPDPDTDPPAVTTSALPGDPGEGVADKGNTTEYRIKIPNLLDDSRLPEDYDPGTPGDEPNPDAEKPVTGWEKANEYHTSHKTATVSQSSITSYNFTEWHEGRSALSLFDGDDNYFNEEGSGTKMGGGLSGDLIVEFRTNRAVTLSGYAFVTGNDSGQYPERSPGAWTLSGSTDGKTWVVLDEVKDGGIRAADHEYFGYEIDGESQGSYTYYRFEFTKDVYLQHLTSFQLNELYLYIDRS